ncbi:MAG: hypothetical protein WBO32_13485, partial [Cyclobacteriaceae bacterium]
MSQESGNTTTTVETPVAPQTPVETNAPKVVADQQVPVSIPESPKLPSVDPKYAELEARYKELEARASVKPFVNEFTEKLNKMYEAGEDPARIQMFIKLNTDDIASKSPVDVIKTQLHFENPRWTPEMIDNYIDEKYGEIPDKAQYEEDDNLDEYHRKLKTRELKIQRDAIDAENFLKKEKASFELKSDDVKSNMEASRAELQQKWTPVVQTIKPDPNLFAIEIDSKEIDGVGSFSFKWEPNITPEVLQQVHDTVLQNATDAGLPLTQQNLSMLTERANQIIKIAYYEEFMTAAIADAVNSTKKAMTMASVSPGRLPQGSGDPRGIVPKHAVKKFPPR